MNGSTWTSWNQRDQGVLSLPFACLTRIPEDPGNGRCSDPSPEMNFPQSGRRRQDLKLSVRSPKTARYDAVDLACGRSDALNRTGGLR